MRFALSVAGSDPTGGAGLLADVQVFRAHGVHGGGVVTALTVQDTVRVHRVMPAFPSVVLEQLRALLRDVRPDAVKLGMLATDDVARAVALGLQELGPPASRATPLVVDPVLCASDGTRLLERRAVAALCDLIRDATLVTPNLPEAAELTDRDVSTRAGVEAAARELVGELGARAALVKGGHATRDADDLLATRDGGGGVALRWLAGERIEGPGAHGTGCALAAAATARLARGDTLEAAVEGARHFVRSALERAEKRGAGRPLLALS